MRALAHPLRLRLVELFAQCPRTPKQAAALLGVPPTRLYHHVHALEHAGLIRLRETRPKRGASEKYYEVPPETKQEGLVHPPASAGPAGLRQRVALAAAGLEVTRRDLAAAFARAGSAPPRGAPLLARVLLPSTAAAERIRADLVELLRRYAAPAPPGEECVTAPTGDEDRWALTLILLPSGPPPDPR
jgi:hypothetical protein